VDKRCARGQNIAKHQPTQLYAALICKRNRAVLEKVLHFAEASATDGAVDHKLPYMSARLKRMYDGSERVADITGSARNAAGTANTTKTIARMKLTTSAAHTAPRGCALRVLEYLRHIVVVVVWRTGNLFTIDASH